MVRPQRRLVSRVADCCTLQDYVSCRAVCAAWRAALLPPSSRLLAPVPADGAEGEQPLSLGVCSHHAQRWTRLLGVPQPPSGLLRATGCRCVGARDGWVALAADDAKAGTSVLLFNPLTGVEIPLHASLYNPKCKRAAKVVFSPCPTPRDFAAVSICWPNKLAIQRSTDGHSSSLLLETDALMDRAVLADVAYGDDGKVYCLTTLHVLHLNRRRHRGRLRPVEVEPLVTGTDLFSTPYDTISLFTDAKNLVLCDGVLYQVWRRPTGRVMGPAAAPHLGERRLRPEVRPVQPAVLDRGEGFGRPRGATEVTKSNCLYYWASRPEGDYEAVVYNMATRRSRQWLPATGGARVSSPLWYFLPAGVGNVEATAVDEAAAYEEVISIAATLRWPYIQY